MISVVIPSMMRVERIWQTISELSSIDIIGEIILIDNTNNLEKKHIDKLNHVCEGKNTYINPAWNKGSQLAKFDKLCVMNDDIWFDWSIFEFIHPYITEDIGMIGMDPSNYSSPTGLLEITPSDKRTFGYACCFFIHKKRWVEIPEEMKLWCGDDWLFYKNGKTNFKISGMKCEGYISTTLDSVELESEFNPIKANDRSIMVGLMGDTVWF